MEHSPQFTALEVNVANNKPKSMALTLQTKVMQQRRTRVILPPLRICRVFQGQLDEAGNQVLVVIPAVRSHRT